MKDIAAALAFATRTQDGAIDRVDAEWLLAHVLNKPRSWLYAFSEAALSEAQQHSFMQLLERRGQGEPVAYLTGTQGFWTLALKVTPATLIPRPETELLVSLALANLADTPHPCLLDMGTGSGAIALALATELPSAQITAVDVSSSALAVASENMAALGCRNTELLQSDWFSALAGRRFDGIVSNPPYIETGDAHLRQGDLRFEPISALSSGVDGLDAIRRIVQEAPGYLLPQGWLMLEHGWQQGEAVRALLANAGFTAVATHRDLEQRERVSFGRSA